MFPNLTTSPGIVQATNLYAARQMLKFQKPVLVLSPLGTPKELPRNKSAFISWRRSVPFSPFDKPLVEGQTPSATQFRYERVQNQIRQYGFLVPLTDQVEDLHEDPVLEDAYEQVGYNLGRTIEQITYGVVRAGTNVVYSNGADRSAVNTPVTASTLRAAVRALKRQKARKKTSIIDPGIEKVGTFPIEASYIATVHTDLENDIRNLPGFYVTAQYGNRTVVSPHEFGTFEEIRFLSTPDLEPFVNAGGPPGSSVLSQGGTAADVYPILIFGDEAFGVTPLAGMGSVTPFIRRPGSQSDSGDPLAQRGWVGVKTYFCATRLNEAWMVRVECAATAI